ncbi:ribonuclease P/MRP subunit p40 [Phyllostomus discolor]|nr:ribonuclease P/MRP subunit p40 [Phyllostomus discolor]
MDLSFNLDSKKYKRISWSFKEKKPLKFNFLLAWHPTGMEESTMMSYFSNYGIQEHQPKIAVSMVTDLQCPVLQSSELRGKLEVACSARELFDWLGAVFSNADLNNEPSNFISTYCCPQPSTLMAKASLCTITGFILPEKICLLLEQLWYEHVCLFHLAYLCQHDILGAVLLFQISASCHKHFPFYSRLGLTVW